MVLKVSRLVVSAFAVAVVSLTSATMQPDAYAASTRAPTAASKRAITALLDAFIPAAVERQKPLRALPLVTSAFRGGVTRKEWAHGNLPAMPYHATGTHFPWTVNYAYPREISVTVLLHPAPSEKLGAVAFTAVFKQQGKRWLIDSFIPAASFAPENQRPSILAQTDFLPGAAAARGSAHLDNKWLLMPVAFLALVVLVPVAIVLVNWRRNRLARREYHRPISPS
jgi:hypothetical protein